MLDKAKGLNALLVWMDRVIAQQFNDYSEVFNTNDVVMCSNTEFAAPHVAQYCKKPLIRTCYAPLLPSKKIFPAVFPIINPPKWLTKPSWAMLNNGLDVAMRKTINKNRVKLGLPPMKHGLMEFMAAQSDNLLLYSPSLGETDSDWKFRWHAAGYCFNDELHYEQKTVDELMNFLNKDAKPVIFYTMGSCKHKKRDVIAGWLLDICNKYGWKLVIGAGWWKTGENLLARPEKERENLYILEGVVPHKMIFPYFSAIIHHGGSGTTHSAARAGKPQTILPILIDQFYYARRIQQLGVSPKCRTPGKYTAKTIEQAACALVTDGNYRTKAENLAQKINAEDGIDAVCDYIQRVGAAQAG
jgi:UDP:flavonoid glycosyltransferase YjiC (YdhE family)